MKEKKKEKQKKGEIVKESRRGFSKKDENKEEKSKKAESK